jgi:hypothetical protein
MRRRQILHPSFLSQPAAGLPDSAGTRWADMPAGRQIGVVSRRRVPIRRRTQNRPRRTGERTARVFTGFVSGLEAPIGVSARS